MDNQKLYVDEPCIISFFAGELGWFQQKWQGYLRWLKQERFPDHKFILMTNIQYHPLIEDFVSFTIDLPKEFYELGLETDCYESPLPNSPSGSLTPSDVYANLIEYLRQFYNKEKAIEIWPPRGVNLWIDTQPQIFKRYYFDKIESKNNRPFITIFPRARVRASNRNVPEFVWKETVDRLKEDFTVVISGTPFGACLRDYKDENVINLINYEGDDKLEQTMKYLYSSICSVSSQSGPTHVSLFCGCPTYIIGHEKERHTEVENRIGTPTSFRTVFDYRAIDSQTILQDIAGFLDALQKSGYENIVSEQKEIGRPSLETLRDKKDLIGAEIGVYRGDNAKNMLEALDIKKLYLIDPYSGETNYTGVQGNGSDREKAQATFAYAQKNLREYEDKIVWINQKSEDAVSLIKEDLSFCYIDGCHEYDFVKKDVELYFPKVKDGGLVAGHDYDNPNVSRAVNELFQKQNIKVISKICSDDNKTPDWWIIKGETSDFNSIIQKDIEILNKLIREN